MPNRLLCPCPPKHAPLLLPNPLHMYNTPSTHTNILLHAWFGQKRGRHQSTFCPPTTPPPPPRSPNTRHPSSQTTPTVISRVYRFFSPCSLPLSLTIVAPVKEGPGKRAGKLLNVLLYDNVGHRGGTCQRTYTRHDSIPLE